MTVDDLDSVMAIEEAVYPTPLARLGYINELTRNKHGHYYVLELVPSPSHQSASAQIIGYVGLIFQLDEGHVSVISVHPDYQRCGLGELLLIACLVRMIEGGAVLATLEVRESNLKAQNLYTKYQFEIVGRRKRYYRDTGEDGLIMTVEPLDSAYQVRLVEAWERVVGEISTCFEVTDRPK